jgi:SEC-C motif-containing protein
MECPCRSGKEYVACCGPYIAGQSHAPTPETLMRSRYTAFTMNEMEYLRESMVEEHRHEFHDDDVRRWNKDTTWQNLEIMEASENGDEGMVLFRATFRHKGGTQTLTERSRFVRRDGRWYYLDGEHETDTVRKDGPKVGRNDPCPCGSGKKFKKCCAGRS